MVTTLDQIDAVLLMGYSGLNPRGRKILGKSPAVGTTSV